MPEVFPARPTGSPILLTNPQYVPMPPPLDASNTFSFQVVTMPSKLSLTVFKKQEIGSPRLAPPFDKIGVEGKNHNFEI